MQQLFRPFDRNPNALQIRKHPLFRLLGLRGTIAQHSEAEEQMLEKYAKGRKVLVEIGVAEGASALALKRVADEDGILYLIDPYPPGRIPSLNFTKICAHLHVRSHHNITVHWIEDYSYNASKTWHTPLDFLFIDGDHSYDGCLRDWKEWSPFVIEGGIVALHDARVFPNGWTQNDWGSVKVANELFKESQHADWEIVDEADSLVIVKRKLLPKADRSRPIEQFLYQNDISL